MKNCNVRFDEDGIEFHPADFGGDYEYMIHYFSDEGILRSSWCKNKDATKFLVRPKKGANRFDVFYKFEGKRHKVVDKFWFSNSGDIFQPNHLELYKDEFNVIECFLTGSHVTFVCFNQAGTNLESKIFGLDYLLCKGFNVIGVKQNGDCYQNMDCDFFSKIVQPYVTSKTICYGSSLGGYAALYYGAAMGAEIISASPLLPVEDNVLKLNGRKERGFIFKNHDFNQFNKQNNRVCIFIDPHQAPDLYFYHRYIESAYSQKNVVYLPFAGHASLYHLSYTKQLNKVIDSFVTSSAFQIDLSMESHFTCFNKSIYYKQKGLLEFSEFWIQRALGFSDIIYSQRLRYQDFLNKLSLITNE